jgi:hypothetical protein
VSREGVGARGALGVVTTSGDSGDGKRMRLARVCIRVGRRSGVARQLMMFAAVV